MIHDARLDDAGETAVEDNSRLWDKIRQRQRSSKPR